jgi:predicted dehydrogenase
MTKLRLAVIGTGALGRHHARILSQMAAVELVAVADTNAPAASAVAAACRTRCTGDYRELLDQVEAVVVAVPTFAHCEVAGAFLEAGVHVLVEKPIASTVAQARELVELARRHHCLLQVGHVERFNPAWTAARSQLVDPKYIHVERFSPFAFRSTDVGVVLDVMIHDIDLVLDLVGAPVADVQAIGTRILGDQEDCVQARLTFSNGSIADLTANRVSPVTSRRMQVWSAAGCAHLDFASREVAFYRPGPLLRFGDGPLERARQPNANIEQLKQEIFGKYIEIDKPVIAPCDQLTDELSAFVKCVEARRTPLVSGEVALGAMVVADRILAQVAAAPWVAPATCPLPDRRRAG